MVLGMSLFRPEALTAQTDRQHGDIMLAGVLERSYADKKLSLLHEEKILRLCAHSPTFRQGRTAQNRNTQAPETEA